MADQTQTVAGSVDTVLHLKPYRLRLASPPDARTFKQRVMIIGSSPDADLALEDRQVSRQHCQIEVDERGYRLRDLASKNGTFVGGLRVQDVYLQPGIHILVGSNDIAFELGDEDIEIRLSGRSHFGELIGTSLAMREVFGVLERVAPTDATVLVEGESGTGKELVAEAVHAHSPRAKGPFVVFDCSAVPRDLVESELFGHVKGAFTGAIADKKGAFSRAHGGTLFLDELGELPLDLQPKLLRALDSGQVRPVGGLDALRCDVRVIAATNRNLRREVEAGHFREDLYYRLAVIQVTLPPLRKRPEDIPGLVEHFLDEITRTTGREPMQVSFSTMEKLKRHRWPGNVRELRNFVERAAVLAEGDRVETRFLKLGRPAEDTSQGEAAIAEGIAGDLRIDEDLPFKDAKNRLVEAFETTYWTRLLERTAGNVSKAARIAGVHRKSVEYIMKKLDLSRDDVG